MTLNYAKDCRSAVIPGMRYRDPHAAIEWLVKALGFEKKAVYEGPDGTVMHAELTFGNGMIMLGSATGGERGRTIAQPDELADVPTMSVSLIVTDARAMYGLARAAGAEIVQELAEMPYGGMAFGCSDPEGHRWYLGEYDPWAAV